MCSRSNTKPGDLKVGGIRNYKKLNLHCLLGILLATLLFVTSCSSSLDGGIEVRTPLPNSNGFQTDIPSPLESTEPDQLYLLTTPNVVEPTLTQSPRLPTTITSTPMPIWSWNEAGEVIAPILLYHHVSNEKRDSRYYISTQRFREQMMFLKKVGYTSIPISLLLNALIHGAELPERPVVITFDDGPIDVYENAFPIMREHGYTGVLYLVANRLESEGFINKEQVKEMIAAGWEIGSHGLTHSDVTVSRPSARDEILQSRLDLNDSLGINVSSFAYPFGKMDTYTAKKVSDYGYVGAVGLGKSWKHTYTTQFYLNRIEVYSDYELTELASRLPWPGKSYYLTPTNSIITE